jgi:hypothetical protein
MEADKKPLYSLTGAVWQVPFAILFVYWLSRLPEPGLAVTMLGLAAVVMAVRANRFTRAEEVIWIVIAVALCVVEIRAIRHDHSITESARSAAAAQEAKNFGDIGNGIRGSIRESQMQFQATMSGS